MAAITVNHTRKDYDYDYRKLEKFSKILYLSTLIYLAILFKPIKKIST